MTQQFINVGAAPNDGKGDPIRNAYIKCNDNFTELYNRAQPVPPANYIGSSGDEAGMYAYSANYFYYCYSNFTGNSEIWAYVPAGGNANIILNGNTSVDIPSLDGPVVTTIAGSIVEVVDSTGSSLTGNIVVSDTAIANTFLTAGVDNLIISNTTIATASSNIILDPLMDGSSVTGNVIILGNLSVAGNVTYIDITTSYTSNLLWVAAESANTALQANTAGLAVGPIGAYYATWRYDQPANSWVSDINVSPAVDLAQDLGTPTQRWGNAYANSVVADTVSANSNIFAGIFTSTTGFFMNPNTIVGVHTVPVGYNAMSAGPITVPAGSNVIVPPGSAWTVV